MPRPARVIVVGGGIAGLATALQLKDRASKVPAGLEVRLLEAGARPGGRAQTERSDGFVIERGPTGFVDDAPATAALIQRVGLTAKLEHAAPAASRRFLYSNGRLHAVPSNPIAFLTSPILSCRGRLRVLREPFVSVRPEKADETIYEFASRRIGTEAAEVLVDAMVSGVFAGDSRALSVASTFPAIAALEAEHGSVVRGLIARRRKARQHSGATAQPPSGLGPRGRTSSFSGGLGTLIDAVAAALDGTIDCRHRVVAIAQADDRAPSRGAFRWRVTTAAGAHFEADAVVIAAPSRDAASLLTDVDRTAAQNVGEMPTAPVVVVALAFETHALGNLPDGFGFLAPRSEGLRTLGCIWDSCIFPGRTPAGAFLLRCILGGAHDPSAAHADDESVVASVRRDLGAAMRVTGPPILTRVYRHADGIAQYVRGHRDRLRLIAERLNAVPGLWVTGSSYYGVSINACVEHAPRQADEILAFLGAPCA